MDKVVVVQQGVCGVVWAVGWLFTIGYLQLTFGKGLLGIIIWPYYLGKHFKKPTI